MFYKILHKPTGLYFKPSKYPYHENLSKKGKVYQQKPNIEKWLQNKDYKTGRIYYTFNYPLKEYPYYKRVECNINDFEIIKYNV